MSRPYLSVAKFTTSWFQLAHPYEICCVKARFSRAQRGEQHALLAVGIGAVRVTNVWGAACCVPVLSDS